MTYEVFFKTLTLEFLLSFATSLIFNLKDFFKNFDGTFYHFFKNRRAVFLAAMHRAMLDIDAQADPRPGDESLSFSEYVAKFERRLQAVWRKHSHLVEFYESNQYSPDYQLPELTKQMRSIDVVAEQLTSRHPNISDTRSRHISSVLIEAMYTGLDIRALGPRGHIQGFQREWRKMIAAYIASLDLH